MGRQKKTVLSLLLTIVSLISLVGATFAWMTMSASPTVSDLDLYLISDNNSAFQIAPDMGGTPGEYGQMLDLSGTAEKNGTLLQPVSFTAGKFGFLLPEYGLDGRLAFLNSVPLSDDSRIVSSGASGAADPKVLGASIYAADFWMRANSTPCTVSLTSAYVNSDGIPVQGCFAVGEPVWDEKKIIHKDAGNGSECAIRIGFYFHPTDAETDDSYFVIYEPNADGGNARAVDGTYFTPAADDRDKDLAAGSDRVKLIQQKQSAWSEADTVSKNEIVYSSGEFLSEDLELVTVNPGEERRVTLFVWLEGQDVDCTNAIAGGRILSHIQFAAKASEDLPLQPE